MGPIIQEIAKTISAKFATELELLMTETRDISEFIVAIKVTLDVIGAKLVAEALETLDQAIKDLMMAKKKQTLNQAGAFKLDQRIINKRPPTEAHETIGNLTILNIGKKTSMMQFLRSIRTA